MSQQFNICEAKSRLSQLVRRAQAGEEIIIARGDRPAARLVAIRPPAVKRKPGRMRGRIRIRRDFDAPLPGNPFGCRQ